MVRNIARILPLAAVLMMAGAGSVQAQGAPIVNKGGTYCIDAEGGVHAGAKIIAWNCHGGWNQQFMLTSRTGGELKVRGTNYCVDIPGGDTSKDLVLWTCNGGWNQKWSIRDYGSRGINLVNPGSGLAIAVPTSEWNLLTHGILRNTLKLRLTSPSAYRSDVLWYGLARGTPSSYATRHNGGMIAQLSPGQVVNISGANIISTGGGNIIATGGGN